MDKRLLLQAAACNLALQLRKMMGAPNWPLHDVVHAYCSFVSVALDYQRDPRASVLVVDLQVASDTASRSMCSMENSRPEIADLGTGC